MTEAFVCNCLFAESHVVQQAKESGTIYAPLFFRRHIFLCEPALPTASKFRLQTSNPPSPAMSPHSGEGKKNISSWSSIQFAIA